MNNFAAIYLVIFMCCAFGISIITMINSHDKIIPENIKYNDILNGKWASDFEENFEDSLTIRNQVVGLWGAISYGVFKTGKENKVIVGKQGWLYSTEEFENFENAKNAEARLYNIIFQTNKLLESHNIKLIIALIPAKARVYPEYIGSAKMPKYRQNLYVDFRENLLEKNIITPDLSLLFQKRKNNDQLYMQQDTHWTPQGAKIVAEEIAKNTHDIEFETLSFQIDASEPQAIEGDLEKYIPTGLFTNFLSPPANNITPYIISKSSNEYQNTNSLFGEQNIPIALVGTSYSAIDTWGFEGLLKHALQADVINMALEGKGILEPMAKFLKNTDFTNTKIKLVIWEIPERFIPVSYDDVTFPPAIEGGK